MEKPADLSKVKTVSIGNRQSKVSPELLAKVPSPGASFSDFLDCLPDNLKAQDLKKIIDTFADAISKKRGIVWMMGAHPIKCGLSPLLIEMISRGWISTLSFNGAGAIHDFELSQFGHTSEDVEKGLADGTFGMVRETGEGIFNAWKKSESSALGAGLSLGKYIEESDSPHKDISLCAACYRNNVPVTVHIGIGTDIIHQHPQADGALMGEMSMRDFKLLAGQLKNLNDGGVVMNQGSAVLMPEVFLKALTVARNLGDQVEDFTAVNFDMIQHYRSNTNVVQRPTKTGGGKGFSITGHHEILLPILFTGIQEKLGGS